MKNEKATVRSPSFGIPTPDLVLPEYPQLKTHISKLLLEMLTTTPPKLSQGWPLSGFLQLPPREI